MSNFIKYSSLIVRLFNGNFQRQKASEYCKILSFSTEYENTFFRKTKKQNRTNT